MRILVVEDENLLQQVLANSLKEKGFHVDVASDGRTGLQKGTQYKYDLAIVDLGLPELSGLDLIRKLRQQGITYPILILTARSDWQDKVEGLNTGADDYVVKPFHVEEIAARMNALLRRQAGSASQIMDFGPLSIDLGAKTASINDNPMDLTQYEYNTLEYLARRHGKVVSKTELTEHLYDQDFDRDSNVIEVFIGRLRKKIDPYGTLKPISTIRGQGYRFEMTLGDSPL